MTEPNRMDWASVESPMKSTLLWTRHAPLPVSVTSRSAGGAATVNQCLAPGSRDESDTDPLASDRWGDLTGIIGQRHRSRMNELQVGYARVSTEQQDLTAQRNGLHALGVGDDRIYVDHGLTGANRDRPGLRLALAACRAGDTLVVTKLDRLARSLPDARDILDELTTGNVKLSLGGSIHDPTDSVGRLLFNVPPPADGHARSSGTKQPNDAWSNSSTTWPDAYRLRRYARECRSQSVHGSPA